jgi:hypothetical protein
MKVVTQAIILFFAALCMTSRGASVKRGQKVREHLHESIFVISLHISLLFPIKLYIISSYKISHIAEH